MKGKREVPREGGKSALRQTSPMGDPFGEGEAKPDWKARWGAYWNSGK